MLRAVMAGLICLMCGLQAAHRLSGRVQALGAWQQALEKLNTQCICLRLPPTEILQNALGEQGISREYLTQEERGWIDDCLQAVLNGTQEEQERQLSYACRQMEQTLAQAQIKQRKDGGLFASLGLLGGLCIFLLCL